MGTRKCPFCAEEIKQEAIKCRHCGEMMPEVEQNRQEEQMQAEAKAEIQMTASYAKTKLNISHLFIVVGLVLGRFVANSLKTGMGLHWDKKSMIILLLLEFLLEAIVCGQPFGDAT